MGAREGHRFRDGPSARGLLAVALVATILLLPHMWARLNPFDGGISSSAATFTLHGDLPYRDYWLLYGPLSGWLATAPTALFGPSAVLARLIGLAVIAAHAVV